MIEQSKSFLPTAEEVLSFWFEELTEKDHFVKSDALDETIKTQFNALYEMLVDGGLKDFASTPRAKLAAIIVFDQFTRNMFRGSYKSFSADGLALSLTKKLIASGDHLNFKDLERVFLYMPLMHSENMVDQQLSVEQFKQLGISDNYDYAIKHLKVIDKFGRFPHRNSVLRRISTDEEVVFINTPGTSF